MLRFELLGLKKGYLFSLIRSQFFFTLLPEHGHALGEFVAFVADVGEVTLFFNAPVDRVTVLDSFQVFDRVGWNYAERKRRSAGTKRISTRWFSAAAIRLSIARE